MGNKETTNGIASVVGATAIGNGGNTTIVTPSLSITDSSLLLSTIGDGNTGNLRIEADDSITVSGISQFQSTSFANGNAGNITIDAPNAEITFENHTTLVATSVAAAGTVLETSPESLAIANVLGISQTSTGSSGDITVIGRNLSLSDGAAFNTSTAGQATNEDLANAGNININISDNFTLSSSSQLRSDSLGQGNAGEINITAGKGISLKGSSSIITSVNLLLDPLAQDFTQIREGGDINVTSNSLSLIDGSQIEANTLSRGNAGDINIFSKNINIDGGVDSLLTGVFAQVEANAVGQGGNINLGSEQSPIEQLDLSNRGTISPSTFGEGDAGNLSIFSNDIQLDGQEFLTGLFASVEENAIGQGGNIFVEANSLALSNGGIIDAATESETGEGANINLQVADRITLQSNSFISARAINESDGGNLTIDTDFIIAFPDGNNDIIANAQQGQGGVINIDAESILGLTERPLSDRTNDINASSEDSTLNGDIVINTDDINPIRGTAELPNNPVNVERSVVRACGNSQRAGEANNFIVKGKGGIPATPVAPLSSDSIAINRESISKHDSDAAQRVRSALNGAFAPSSSRWLCHQCQLC